LPARFAALLVGLLALFGARSALAAPEIQTWQTAEGAEVLFVAADQLPMVDLQLMFDAGSARDGDQSGLASLTSAMLTEGAGGLNADQIAERVEAVGANLSTATDRDTSSVQLRSLTEPEALEVALDTLIRMLGQPSFDASELERVRQNRLTALRLADQDPGSVGQKALYRAVFGEHPYAADPSGTAETIAALGSGDLRAFHRRYYGAANATIAIVGALDRLQAEAMAARVSAALPAVESPPPLPPVPALTQPERLQIAFPSSQTHLYLGQPGMRRGDPDYFALYLGNHILGGSGLVSLLMEEVREKRGLSYSVYSYFLPLARKGPLLMGLQTQNAQADEAERVLRETLTRFIEEGPSDEQLEAAVKNITGGFPLRIAGNSKIVGYLSVIGFYDLPLDYLEVFPQRIRELTKEQVRDAFQRRVDPARLVRVSVGAAAEPAAAISTEPAQVVDAERLPAAVTEPAVATEPAAGTGPEHSTETKPQPAPSRSGGQG
jgi:zinc protease